MKFMQTLDMCFILIVVQTLAQNSGFIFICSDDTFLKFMMGAEQMAQQFRAQLLAHGKDAGLIPNTHTVVHNIQNPSSMASNGLFCGHQACIQYTHTHMVQTLIHIE